MADIGLSFEADEVGASQSIESIVAALDPTSPQPEAAHLLAQFLRGSIDGANDCSDLFRCEVTANAAGGALELVSIQVLPSDRFLELVTAVAGEREDVSLVIRHGWPILSVGDPFPTVAEGQGESIALAGGAA